MPRTTDTRALITAFEEKAAGALAAIAEVNSIDDAGLKANLATAGITAKVTATCDNLAIEVTVPPTPGLKAGENADDLTDAAKERRAQDYLKARKAATWTAVKSMTGTGRGKLSTDDAMSLLTTLGYSDASLPLIVTTVSGEMARGRENVYDSFSFTMKGQQDKDGILEKLLAVASHNSTDAKIVTAFGEDAILSADRAPVRNLTVTGTPTWPAKSEFHAA
jgi:hypothetical protein